MPITAQSIIQRVVETLQDPTSIRWPVAELVRYLNDGQREVVLHRPDAMRKSAAVALTANSTRQTIPADGLKLIDIVRNTGGTKRAVRQVNREILDAQTPGWHGLAGATEILHFMFDPRDPTTFYVYPPAGASSSVEILYAASPADATEPASGALYGAVTGNISVPDIYGNALQDYILFRAYAKDSEYAGNAARAQNHYAVFANSLGIEVKATLAVAPTTQGNPNMARAVAAQG